jgi:3-oxoacyl-[acyl-carrier protein] reductase
VTDQANLISKIEDWKVGDSDFIEFEMTRDLVSRFADLTGDLNPLHIDRDFAKRTGFGRPVAHGMISGAMISTLIGMKIPGSGALWTSQTIEFLRPVFIGDKITIRGTVSHVSVATSSLTIEVNATNQRGDDILSGKGLAKIVDVEIKESKAEHESEGGRCLVLGGSSDVALEFIKSIAHDQQVIATYNSNRVEVPFRGSENVEWIQADFSDGDSTQVFIDSISKSGQSFSSVVHFASSYPDPKPFEASSGADFVRQLTVSVISFSQIIRALILDQKLAGGASVVALSSVYTNGKPPTSQAPYVVSKYALNGLMKCLAAEFGPQGIRFNLIIAGMIKTKMISELPEKAKLAVKINSPLRSLAVTTDITGVIGFLISPGSEHMTGAEINVSGGWSM